MGYGWNIEITDTLPITCGLEQEIAIYKMLSENGFEFKNKEEAKMEQLAGKGLTRFFESFIDEFFQVRSTLQDNSIFVENGRIYVDQQKNLEFCTPECTDPRELALRLCYFRQKLKDFIIKYPQFRAFNESSSSEATFGFHENYLTAYNADHVACKIVPKLIPHFVSRVVLTGTGGQGRFKDLCISPRLSWIERTLCETSTHDRGFVQLKSDRHSNFGTRIQVGSSDQPISAENIMLETSITSFALRLAELGRLPETQIDWFGSKDQLNTTGLNQIPVIFKEAVKYQQQLYDAAKEYVNLCEQQGFHDIFDNPEVSKKMLDLWQSRIDLLNKYIATENIDVIAQDIEWASKHRFVKYMREKKNIPLDEKIGRYEVWFLGETTSFVPRHQVFESMQSDFTDWPNKAITEFSLERPRTRAEALRKLQGFSELYGPGLKLKIDWGNIELFRLGNRGTLILENPFSGNATIADELFETFFSNRNNPREFTLRAGAGSPINQFISKGKVLSR